MPTTIPAKQLQVVADTVEDLQRLLLRKETGWCRSDNTLYIKKENDEVVPVAATEAYVNAAVDVALDAVDVHEHRTDNPHQVTAEQVGAATPNDLLRMKYAATNTLRFYRGGPTS